MADAPHDVSIALLGPLVVEVRGQPVDVPAGHQRRLLAALAIDVGRVVSTERLVDLLWADEPPRSARNSLQSQLARLRRRLGGEGTIEHEPPGYRLADGAADVDVSRFERLADEAMRTTDPVQRRDLLDDALALWRADEPTVLDASGLAEDVMRLVRRRHLAQVERATVALATGDLATAEADARSVLRADHLHEPAVVLLVRVLAADGRVAEADATVQGFRDRLADELGLDPSPALDAVHTALLRGQLGQVATSPATAAAPPGGVHGHGQPTSAPSQATTAHSPGGRSRQLEAAAPPARPALPRSSFRGRQAALADLGADVASLRCVTVVGPGGVGKTRLALELVHREHRDVVWADLLEARTRDDVLGRLALAAGCGTPADIATLSPLDETLTGREALVVLDNCEQAVAEVADVVDALLHATTGTTVLATSRAPLGVDGEHVVELAPLPTTSPDDRRSPALTLFADRVGRTLDLTDPDRHLVAREVVAALDGLPLALELAARQARNLGLAAVRDRLDDRLELLGSPRSGDHPAHADLRSLVRWSTDQLGEDDRRVFRWLSVFAGAFALTQAEDLLARRGAGVPAVAASVARLVEQSLVARRPPDRFLLLETLRVCAAEDLEAAGETAAARAGHTRVVVSAVESAAALLGTVDEVAGTAALRMLVPDVQVVTDRLVDDRDVEGLCRLACALRRYADFTQHLGLLRCALAARRLLDEGHGAALAADLRDGATVAAAVAVAGAGDLDGARRLVETVLTDEGSGAAVAAGWSTLGDILLWQADPGAEEAYRQAVRTSDAAGDAVTAVAGWVGVALFHAFLGDVARSRRAVTELERRAQRIGAPSVSAWAAYARGEAEADHDPTAALDAFDRAIEQARTVDGHLLVAAAGTDAAAVRARHGDPVTVLPDVRDTLRGLARSSDALMQEYVLRAVSVLLTRMGSDEAAATVMGATSSSPMYAVERRRVEVAAAALAERLGDDVVERRRAAGARMAPGEVVDVALLAVEQLIDG